MLLLIFKHLSNARKKGMEFLMKKKVFFITSSILQIVLSVIIIINYQQIIEQQITSVREVYAIFPSDFQERVLSTLKNCGPIYLLIGSILTIILNILVINISINGKILKKKWLLIAISLTCFILSEHPIISLLSIIGFIVLLASKRINPEDLPDPKKEIPEIKYEKSSKKELVLGILLVAIYFSQLLLNLIINDNTPIFISKGLVVAFYATAFISAIAIFKEKFTNDFELFNNNFGTYFKYIMPKLGLMFLIYLPCSIICILISKKSNSINQSTLESLPLWFTFPLAVFWAPIVEEMVFRGVIRRFIKNNISFIIISAVSFGLLHTISEETIQNIFIRAIPYSILGGYLAYIYTKTNNIMSNIFSHSFINLVAITLSTLATANIFLA